MSLGASETRDNRPYQTVDAMTSITIGLALSVLRDAARGRMTLRQESDGVEGTTSFMGKIVLVRFTPGNFIIPNHDSLLEPDKRPNERLEDVAKRLYALAVEVAEGLSPDARYLELERDVEAYLRDQKKVRVEIAPEPSPQALQQIEAPRGGREYTPNFELRARYDHEEVTLLSKLEDLEKAWAQNRASDLQQLLKGLTNQYERYLERDLKSGSNRSALHLATSHSENCDADLARLNAYRFRQIICQKCFELFTRSYGAAEADRACKESLSTTLENFLQLEHMSSTDNFMMIRPQTFLEKTALMELFGARALKLAPCYLGGVSDAYAESHFSAAERQLHNCFRRFHSVLFWEAMEGSPGMLNASGAEEQKSLLSSRFGRFPELKALYEYAVKAYVADADSTELARHVDQNCNAQLSARAYRNSCIVMVQKLEDAQTEIATHLYPERARAQGKVQPFREFIEAKAKERI